MGAGPPDVKLPYLVIFKTVLHTFLRGLLVAQLGGVMLHFPPGFCLLVIAVLFFWSVVLHLVAGTGHLMDFRACEINLC